MTKTHERTTRSKPSPAAAIQRPKKVTLKPWEREMMYEALKSLDLKRLAQQARPIPALFNETFEQVCPHCGKNIAGEERTGL